MNAENSSRRDLLMSAAAFAIAAPFAGAVLVDDPKAATPELIKPSDPSAVPDRFKALPREAFSVPECMTPVDLFPEERDGRLHFYADEVRAFVGNRWNRRTPAHRGREHSENVES